MMDFSLERDGFFLNLLIGSITEVFLHTRIGSFKLERQDALLWEALLP